MTRYHPFQGKAIVAVPFFFLIEEKEGKRKAPQRFLSAELFDNLRVVTGTQPKGRPRTRPEDPETKIKRLEAEVEMLNLHLYRLRKKKSSAKCLSAELSTYFDNLRAVTVGT